MKALILLSGGLDSILAAELIRQQGIETIGVGFKSPFFGCEKGRRAARELGMPFYYFDIASQLIEILKHPRYGYGKNLNPCIDCHRMMVREAFRRMEYLGASFVVTGEVLGERPKSQNHSGLNAVAKAGKEGLLLRPLSALLLEETIPEREGWVNRQELLDISGRSRKRQIELAARFGIKDYPSPAGGCLLTESGYCRKLLELKNKEGWKAEHLELLRLGRHFRLLSGNKAVSGRNEAENRKLHEIALPDDYFFQAVEKPGSLALLRAKGGSSGDDIKVAASICTRYSKGEGFLRLSCWRKKEQTNPDYSQTTSN